MQSLQRCCNCLLFNNMYKVNKIPSNTDSSILFEHMVLDRERPSKSFFYMNMYQKDIFIVIL